MTAHEQIAALRSRMAQSIIGQEAVVERLIIGSPCLAILSLNDGVFGIMDDRIGQHIAVCV